MKYKLVRVPVKLSYEEFKDIVIDLECVMGARIGDSPNLVGSEKKPTQYRWDIVEHALYITVWNCERVHIDSGEFYIYNIEFDTKESTEYSDNQANKIVQMLSQQKR